MLIQDQFGINQNLQTSPIPQTSFLPWTIFAASYSKIALKKEIFMNYDTNFLQGKTGGIK